MGRPGPKLVQRLDHVVAQCRGGVVQVPCQRLDSRGRGYLAENTRDAPPDGELFILIPDPLVQNRHRGIADCGKGIPGLCAEPPVRQLRHKPLDCVYTTRAAHATDRLPGDDRRTVGRQFRKISPKLWSVQRTENASHLCTQVLCARSALRKHVLDCVRTDEIALLRGPVCRYATQCRRPGHRVRVPEALSERLDPVSSALNTDEVHRLQTHVRIGVVQKLSDSGQKIAHLLPLQCPEGLAADACGGMVEMRREELGESPGLSHAQQV